MSDRTRKPVWARWRLREGGQIEVALTYSEGSGYTQEERTYASLDEATQALGQSFREVVIRVTQTGSQAGRWRP